MHFENEASVLDFRSGICLLFRGQNMRSHHSLWVIFLICKEKSCPVLNSLASFLLEPVLWKVPAWVDFGKHILNRCALWISVEWLECASLGQVDGS